MATTTRRIGPADHGRPISLDDFVDAEFRKLIARNVATIEKNRFCFQCHDEDNSPNFNFTTYWGQVVHKGLDKYDDPKVHQGLKVERGQPAAN